MITIELTQIQSVEPGPAYRSDTAVTSTVGIDQEIFVFQTADDVFSHVASVWDMDNIPATKADALTAGSDTYREIQVVRDFAGIDDAQNFSDYTRARTQLLATEYNELSEGFEGSVDYTIEAGV